MCVVMIIGIAGRTASGKTSVALALERNLSTQLNVKVLHMNDFYRQLNAHQMQLDLQHNYNWDCLEAYDLEALIKAIQNTDYDVCIVEGIYLFAVDWIVDMFDLRVWVDVDDDTSLARRLRRGDDDVLLVLQQYEKYVKPAYDLLAEPSRCHAHIFLARGSENTEGLGTIISYITAQRKKKKSCN